MSTRFCTNHVEVEATLRDIDDWFGLSYCNYLVLPRTLLQSMPDEWQHEFVTLLEQLRESFRHIEQADVYKVEAATEHIVDEMTPGQMKAAGVTADEDTYYDADGNQLEPFERVLLPAHDPIPHYNRGRTRIEPRPIAAATS